MEMSTAMQHYLSCVIPLIKKICVGIMGITERRWRMFMEQETLIERITDLEREISLLPEGSITKKKIREKEYYYHRITRDGKRVENYLDFDDVPELSAQITKRKELEKELKHLKSLNQPEKPRKKRNQPNFKTLVRTGEVHCCIERLCFW